MLRTPGASTPRTGLATQRTVAVLLGFASAALVLVAFVLPHLAGEAGSGRQVRAAPGGDPSLTVSEAPGSSGAVVILEAEAPPPVEEQEAAEGLPVQALVPSQAPAANAAALESTAPNYPPLKYERGEGKVEQLTPRQARERAKTEASERRKQRAEQGLPPVEKPEAQGAEATPLRPKDATRRQSKYPGRGKGKRRGG